MSYRQFVTKDCDTVIDIYYSENHEDSYGSGQLYCSLKSDNIYGECIFPSCPSGYEGKLEYPGSDSLVKEVSVGG